MCYGYEDFYEYDEGVVDPVRGLYMDLDGEIYAWPGYAGDYDYKVEEKPFPCIAKFAFLEDDRVYSDEDWRRLIDLNSTKEAKDKIWAWYEDNCMATPDPEWLAEHEWENIPF